MTEGTQSLNKKMFRSLQDRSLSRSIPQSVTAGERVPGCELPWHYRSIGAYRGLSDYTCNNVRRTRIGAFAPLDFKFQKSMLKNLS